MIDNMTCSVLLHLLSAWLRSLYALGLQSRWLVSSLTLSFIRNSLIASLWLCVCNTRFFGTLSAMVTVKHLLQKNVKCRNLLENDAGGGSVSGPIAVSFHTILWLKSSIICCVFSVPLNTWPFVWHSWALNFLLVLWIWHHIFRKLNL